jgi:hypothetical protein
MLRVGQGGTIKSLVNLLHITRAAVDEEPTLSEEINTKLFEHVMAGVEIISGKLGHFYWQVRSNRTPSFFKETVSRKLCKD